MMKLFEIDRLMAKSLTKQICDGFRAAIADGRLAGGDRFPTCREICGEFGVSMIVSSAVVRQLGREGLICSRPHLGSFVVPQGNFAWKGHVLFINSGGVVSAYASVLSCCFREYFSSAGWLFSEIDMPSKFIGDRDEARLVSALAAKPNLVLSLHSRPEVDRAVSASGIAQIVIADGSLSQNARYSGIVRTDYTQALSSFAVWCGKNGVKDVLQVGFESGYATARTELSKVGIGFRELLIKETKDFWLSWNVREAAFKYFSKNMLKIKRSLPDIFYFTDNYLAAGALAAMDAAGIALGEEVKVASISDDGGEPFFKKPIMLVKWDWREIAGRISDCVISYLEGDHTPFDFSVCPKFADGSN